MKRFAIVAAVVVAATLFYALVLKGASPAPPTGPAQPGAKSPGEKGVAEKTPPPRVEPPPPPPPPPTPEPKPVPPPPPPSAADATLAKAADLEASGKREEAWAMLSDAWKATADRAERKRLSDKLGVLGPAMALSPEKLSISEIYVVQSGDAYEKIAKKFKITHGLILRMNNRQGSRVDVGDRLKVVQGPPEILVVKSEFTLTLLLKGRFVKQWTVGIGKFDKTPEGTFEVATKKENPDWTFQGRVYKFGDKENILGTRWMGFKNTPEHKGYGIHGSVDGKGVGEESSNGCVRMRNEEVEELYPLVPYGASVTIRR